MPARYSRWAVAKVRPAGSSIRFSPDSSSSSLGLQPAVAAHREGAGHLPGHGQLQGRHQVVDVAELPARRAALDGQQPGRLEVPGDQGVHALADQGGGPDHGDGHARVGLGRALRELLDLQQVADHAAVLVGPERRVLGQRHGVVGPGPVDHRAGDQHDPADPAGRRGGQHGLRAADVERPPGLLVGVGRQVQVGVHDDVHAGQPPGQGRVADVDDPPGDPGGLAPVIVDGDHPADPGAAGQPGGQGLAQPPGRAGHGDDRPGTVPFASFSGMAWAVQVSLGLRRLLGALLVLRPRRTLASRLLTTHRSRDSLANMDASILPERPRR